MTPEQRFDRLERIVKLMIRSGLRSRRLAREQDEKINIIIEMQMDNVRGYAELRASQAKTDLTMDQLAKSHDRLTESQDRLAKSEDRLAESQNRLAKSQDRLTESQAHTDRRLETLIDIVQERKNGN